jgi:biotin carboxyl carrier protein
VDVAPAVAGAAPQVTNVAPVAAAPAAAAPAAGTGTEITAPMPGTVMKVLVAEGDSVAAGDTVVVIEAMKMEQPIKAQSAGTVQSIEVSEGETVDTGQVVVVI